MMNYEEQIKVLARVYDEATLKASETLGSMNEGPGIWYAKAVYEAGFRQAYWLRFIGPGLNIGYQCSACRGEFREKKDRCECGAIMYNADYNKEER